MKKKLINIVKIVSILNTVILLSLSCPAFAGERLSTPARIISLAPNMTEILFALGLGDNIVGVTSFCDHPEAAQTKQKIGGMSNPSLEAVVLLKPDLVVMTTDGNPKEFEERLRSLKIKTFVFTARRLSELPQGIRELGAAVGAHKEADKLAQAMETAISTAGSGVRGQGTGSSRMLQNSKLRTGSTHAHHHERQSNDPNAELNKTKVLFIVWPEPLIVAGRKTAMDDAITLLGHENIASRAKSEYPKYSIEEVIRQAPDVIIIGKGSGMDMVAVSRGLLKRMTSVPAVKSGAVCYLGDGLYRLGPRVVQGIEELAECLNQK